MSIQARHRGIGLIGQRAPRAIPVPDFNTQVDGISPAVAGHLTTASGSTWTERIAGDDWTLVNSPELGLAPLVSGGADSLGFYGGGSPAHATRANFLQGADEIEISFALLLQVHPGAGGKYVLLALGGTPSLGVEIQDDGAGGCRARLIREADTGTVVHHSGTDTVPLGQGIILTARWHSDGTQDALVDGVSVGSMTLESGTPGTWTLVGSHTAFMGVWVDGTADPLKGRLADVTWWQT